MGYVARPETLLTPEYGCRGNQRVNRNFWYTEVVINKMGLIRSIKTSVFDTTTFAHDKGLTDLSNKIAKSSKA